MSDTPSIESVRKIVVDTLVSEFELERDKIVPAARLREDLGLDSLDGVDLIVALEKALSVQIPETDARQIRTVQDIFQFIEKTAAQMAGGGAPAAQAPAASEPPKA